MNEKIKEIITYIYRAMIGSPEELGRISNPRVNDLLLPLTNNIFLSDNEYSTTSMTNAKAFTKKSMIETDKWIAEKHDCDNFSYALNGYWADSLYSFCFGIAWSKSHAFNIMIDNNEVIWICEPQTNTWILLEEAKLNKDYYPFRMILI
jgi:hypothetical protein